MRQNLWIILLTIFLSGCTANLQQLIKEGNTEGVKQRVASGEPVSSYSKEEGIWGISPTTPLHDAVHYNRPQIVEILLDAGADPNVRDINGLTPLAHASKRNNRHMAGILLEHGARIDPAYSYAPSPLDEALSAGQEAMAKTLIEKGGDVNVRNTLGETPLFTAAQFGSEEIVRYLIDAGADIHATSLDGRNALNTALLNKSTKVLNILFDKGVKISPTMKSEMGLYTTAMLYDHIGRRELSAKNTKAAINNFKHAADYFSKAGDKFHNVAKEYHDRAANTALLDSLMMALATAGSLYNASNPQRVKLFGGHDMTDSGIKVKTSTLQFSSPQVTNVQQRSVTTTINVGNQYEQLANDCEMAAKTMQSISACLANNQGGIDTCLSNQ